MTDGNGENEIMNDPSSGLWTLLTKWYEKLPEPFKVVAFFLVLLSAIFIVVSPKTVGGSVKFLDKLSKERNLSGQMIRVYIQSNYFPYQTQSRGEFIIPVVNFFGGTAFKIDDPNDPDREVTGEISVADVWSSYFRGRPLKIMIDKDSVNVTVGVSELKIISLFSPAVLYAEELILPKVIARLKPQGADQTAVQAEVKLIIEAYSDNKSIDIAHYTIDGDKSLTLSDKLAIYNEIMDRFGIDLPVNIRSSLQSIKQLSAFIISQKKIQEYLGTKNIKVPSTLYETLKVLPQDAQVQLKK